MLYFVLAILCLLVAAAFYFINVLVNRWIEQKNKTKGLQKHILVLEERINKLEGKVEAHSNLFSGVAMMDDIEREANAMLNVKNDIGKLGNRVQALEKEIRK